ncbi:NAD(P)/FAD-dependent oxidoreductase [Patescibacteria group bacterium]|nr:NAD(P)/FAD-dependent oxidoreductase [Patescibacteria group bacterium]
MEDKYDVIIVGAGPGGLSCAVQLQDSGKSVLVLEKNKGIGPKICAGGLTTKIQKIGYELDIADRLYSEIKICVPGQEKIVKMPQPFVATIDRGKLGKIMLGKIDQQVQIKTGLKVEEISDDFVVVDGKKIGYKYLVGADGSNSMVRKWLGVKTDKSILGLQYILSAGFDELELFFDADYFANGYAWIFPHQDFTSVGCGCELGVSNSSELKKNFDEWLEVKKISTESARFEGWVINFDYQGYSFDNKFLVGDAGGFASGMTGEGIYFAMVSGIEVAKKIIDPAYNCEGIENILKIKKRQERFLGLTRGMNKKLLNAFYGMFPMFFGMNWFKKRAIELFS